MEKKKTLHVILSSLICLSMALVFLAFYSRLPNSIPIHFDVTGKPNNSLPKIWVIFVFPISYLLINLYRCYTLISKDIRSVYRFYIIPALAVLTTFLVIFLALR